MVLFWIRQVATDLNNFLKGLMFRIFNGAVV